MKEDISKIEIQRVEDLERLEELGLTPDELAGSRVILGASVLVVEDPEEGARITLLKPSKSLDRHMIEGLPATLSPEVRVPFLPAMLGRESLKVQVRVLSVVELKPPLRTRIEMDALDRLEAINRERAHAKLRERLE